METDSWLIGLIDIEIRSGGGSMETKNSVNLSVNPCKMCMPLGGVMAMKGIENSMVILHGSQGCSTYIRQVGS